MPMLAVDFDAVAGQIEGIVVGLGLGGAQVDGAEVERGVCVPVQPAHGLADL